MNSFRDLDIPELPDMPDIMMNTNVRVVKEMFPHMLVEDLITDEQYLMDWNENLR